MFRTPLPDGSGFTSMFRLHQLQHEILQLFSSFLLQFCAASGGDAGGQGRISSVAITWLTHVKLHLLPFRALKQFPFHLVFVVVSPSARLLRKYCSG